MHGPDERARILVVDDQQDMADLIAEDLCDRGYDALALSSGPDALRRLRTERFDALVTDLRMPEVDGLTLLRVSRSLDPSRPVVMMTGYESIETALEALEYGTWQYLTKPFRMEVLARLLESALRIRDGR
jgi:DNA-binding NtrC family response regulator